MYTFIYIIVFTTYNLYAPPSSSVGFASVVPPGRARDAWQRPGRCGVHSRSDQGIDGVKKCQAKVGKKTDEFLNSIHCIHVLYDIHV